MFSKRLDRKFPAETEGDVAEFLNVGSFSRDTFAVLPKFQHYYCTNNLSVNMVIDKMIEILQ